MSVLARLVWCVAAYASSGCTWNESGWSVWMNLIRRGSSTFCPEPRGAAYQTSLPQGRSTTFDCSLNGAVPPLLLPYNFLDPTHPPPAPTHICPIPHPHRPPAPDPSTHP